MGSHQRHVVGSTILLKIGGITFSVADGKLCIHASQQAYPLSGCETLEVLNYLEMHKLDIIVLARDEQRASERRKRANQGHTQKTQWVMVNGQWVEAVEVKDLQKEQDAEDGDEDEE